MSRRGWVLFVALGIIWGLPYLLIKVSVRELSAPMLVEIRTGGGALLLLPIAIAGGHLRPVLARWRPILVYSVVEIAVPWLLLFDAEKKLSSSLAGLLIAAVPLVAAVLASMTGSADRLDRRRLFGVLLGLAGVAALVGFDVGRSDLLAAASLGVVAIGYALGPWILSRYLSEMPALGVVTCSLLVCAVLYAPIAAFSLPTRSLTWQVVSSAVALTVVCTVAAFLIFFALISEVGPARSTVITYVNPAVAVLLGTTVLGERFGIGTAVGFALIVGGCVFATARTSRLAEPAESGGLVASGDAPALEPD